MNAMTGHDYTFYPFATTNKVDFKNLMDVYLDATLNPLLKETDFYQEGWRLENEITEDAKSPLTFKGVVYNEMKGQVSDSSYYFWIKFQESIYPSLNNSGGDPRKMTTLEYEDLVDFHSDFYHPSNSRTFTYGDIPLAIHLEKINNEFLRFGKRNQKDEVKQPIELKEKETKFVVDGPVDPMLPPDRQVKSSLTWFAGKPTDNYETLLLKILSSLLSDGHSSPLYQTLIETGLGADFSINSGLDSMTAVNLFTIGLNGLTKEKAEELPQIILAELEKAKLSFNEQKVKAIIHRFELSRKVESSNFGLNLLSGVVPGWVNGVSPLESLKWSEVLDRFQQEYKEKGDQLFVDLIDKYLISQPYIQYTMQPNEKLAESLAQEEQTRLAEKVKPLNEEDKKIVHNRGLDLLKKQTEKEDLSCLPTLSVADINRDVPFVRVGQNAQNNVLFQTRLSPKTNGLTYFRALKTVQSTELPPDLVQYLPLFTECLNNLGTTTKSMADLEDELKLYTGGVSARTFVHSSLDNPSEVFLKFGLSGLALDHNFEKMLSLTQQLVQETNFKNIPKLSTLVKSLTNDNLSSIVSSGHSYARSYATSKISASGKLDDK
ncbi:unnamed protein product [Ambrosiozyma monospora]|uniref:Unnamed protein product n=1 Tax=Ambrosiozyma monospora TaxID=43982 RepID=A0ACB5T980_AMBMO|nr:unnamed protein product [Ambrosiozyma monospora]